MFCAQAPCARSRPTRRAHHAVAEGPLPRTLALMIDASPTPVAPADPHGTEIRLRHRNPLGNLLRGALIGVVETNPGVSGGTVALVTGIYEEDRKSTRLNSSHVAISYAVFCLKKKTT